MVERYKQEKLLLVFVVIFFGLLAITCFVMLWQQNLTNPGQGVLLSPGSFLDINQLF
jgi:hypothetical protein